MIQYMTTNMYLQVKFEVNAGLLYEISIDQKCFCRGCYLFYEIIK